MTLNQEKRKVLEALIALSATELEKWKDHHFAQRNPVEYGPLTPQVAKLCGTTLSTVRKHLNQLAEIGAVKKYLPYKGCMARWYAPKGAGRSVSMVIEVKPKLTSRIFGIVLETMADNFGNTLYLVNFGKNGTRTLSKEQFCYTEPE